jgi:LysM repeat protein
LLAGRTERTEPVVAKARPVASPSTLAAAPTAQTSSEANRVTYRVKRGDTLSSIARVFQTSVAALRSWNGLKSDRLAPGDRLTVYTSRAPSSQ